MGEVMGEIDFLTIDDDRIIHLDQTQRYGGDSSIRDVG